MSEDCHNSDNEQKFTWKCPQCDKVITSWTDHGCVILAKAHQLDHTMEKFDAPVTAIVKRDELTPFDRMWLMELKVGW